MNQNSNQPTEKDPQYHSWQFGTPMMDVLLGEVQYKFTMDGPVRDWDMYDRNIAHAACRSGGTAAQAWGQECWWRTRKPSVAECHFGCVSNTIRLRSGVYLDLANPDADDISLEDIAGALSKICRFGSQVDKFYSVAEHCYLCVTEGMSQRLSNSELAALLLHDATEAFLGDVVKPLKIMLPDYEVIERSMESAISNRFHVDFARHHDVIKDIDQSMLIAERNAMFTRDGVIWTGEKDVRAIDVSFQFFSPSEGESAFLEMAGILGIK